ncbi:MAG TPA: hypothetical protein VG759_12570 [Candidatus Angelobacter sp.]|jgi:hypothetical protein|nr:hypothetical protein [Candidatus Angelobacter sp.]
MLQRIKVITEELQAIHAEISNQLVSNPTKETPSIFDEADVMDFLVDFKGAIDEVRAALWSYIEEMSRRPTENSGAKTSHLLRATEMLRALSQHQQVSKAMPICQEGSFFDRLHTVMDSYGDDFLPVSATKIEAASDPGIGKLKSFSE